MSRSSLAGWRSSVKGLRLSVTITFKRFYSPTPTDGERKNLKEYYDTKSSLLNLEIIC